VWRWLFLANLVRDFAQVQVLPPQAAPTTTTTTTVPHSSDIISAWRHACIQTLLQYPPGTPRCLAMDALRHSLVDQMDLSNTTPADLTPLLAATLQTPPSFAIGRPNDVCQRLEYMLLQKAKEDPDWGVHLCWSLETCLGKLWNELLGSSRRFLLLVPPDVAHKLQSQSLLKQRVFALLQHAEQATAFGDTSNEYRCRYYGDAMQFLDQLTQLSSDLRRIPAVHRDQALQQGLQTINRRLYRRMTTQGQVTMDMPDDEITNSHSPPPPSLALDDLQHAVHLCMTPHTPWPGDSSQGVSKVLQIYTANARLLSSRERCPFLIHVEVLGTNVNGSDPSLYPSSKTVEEGMDAIRRRDEIKTSVVRGGSTTQEVTPVAFVQRQATSPAFVRQRVDTPPAFVTTRQEVETTRHQQELRQPPPEASIQPQQEESSSTESAQAPRGGSQDYLPPPNYYEPHDDPYYYDPYADFRQMEFESLHQDLYHNRPPTPAPLQGSQLLDSVFGDPWQKQCALIRQNSPFGHLKGWKLASFILKAGEDVRREVLVMQVIRKLHEWFTDEIPVELRPTLRPYTIQCVGAQAGLLECLSDAKSLDEVKKKTDRFVSLADYFERAYGHASSPMGLFDAKLNFVKSLVGYSLVCYILQVKDRHNGNILMDREGYVEES